MRALRTAHRTSHIAVVWPDRTQGVLRFLKELYINPAGVTPPAGQVSDLLPNKHLPQLF